MVFTHLVVEIHDWASLTRLVGDVAIALLKEGADFTLKNSDEVLALDMAPDKEVNIYTTESLLYGLNC